MHRTQIYLTQTQQQALDAIAAASTSTRSELIRQAIDQLLAQRQPLPNQAATPSWKQAAGMWADRDDVDDWHRTLREEADRSTST